MAIKVVNVAQIMKAEKAEKEVVGRIFIEALSKDNLTSGAFGRFENSDLFWRTLNAADNHPCKMANYRVWHGNWKLSKEGYRTERKPLQFKGRSLCTCKCDRKGQICECRCAAIIKMAAEFRMRSIYFDRRRPMERFRINPETRMEDLLKEY